MAATLEAAGVWEAGRSESVYRGDAANSVSNSEKEAFRRSPELYRATFLTKTVRSQRSPALDFGGGLHQSVLLPGEASSVAVIPPECLTAAGARSTRGAAWKEFEAANVGRHLLTESEASQLHAMSAALRRHPLAGAFLADGEPEVPVRAVDPATGLTVRARIDWLTEDAAGRPVLADLKTTAVNVADLGAITAAIEKYGYHRQLAFYRRVCRLALGIDEPACLLVFLGKSAPHLVRVVEPDAEWLKAGDAENAETLWDMAASRASGVYAARGIDDVLTVSRPRWATYSDEYAVEA